MTRLTALCLTALTTATQAAPATYNIDPTHTYPSFAADHMGMSKWRGKFNKTAGTITLDKAAGSGTVDITVDMDSVDFGLDLMNTKAKDAELFDTARYPQAHYRGRLEGFKDGAPSKVAGELTLHGVTKPLVITLNSFKCMTHPMLKRDWCGADAVATFNRADFGMDAGKDYGFKMDVELRIQVEAVRAE